jgi:16S rRNA (adenine1518-N6/adenine1519-N6)-dimethyltransferase
MDNILQETKYIMNKYHIKANKSLGQNFLINQEVVEAIVESSQISKEDLVIEIGPGLGTLTKYLLEKARKVICIELDKKMIKILEDRFSLYENFTLINQDVLKVDLQELIEKEKQNKEIKNVKIVANLPYYITTPIIMKLLEEQLDLESITVMIQKEVADRLITIPGEKETGAITYSVYYYAQAQGILEVPNSSFIPEPEVTSKVIKLTIRKEPPVKVNAREVMFRIIKCAFMQRRKTLLNALVNTNIFNNKEQGTQILEKLGIEVNSRAENLTLEDYARITDLVFPIKN